MFLGETREYIDIIENIRGQVVRIYTYLLPRTEVRMQPRRPELRVRQPLAALLKGE